MSRELQDRGFAESPYERPNQEWVCGWASDGRPCPLGPDGRGNCVVTHECTPSLRNDRWVCARQTAFGGPCEDGPLPDGSCCNEVPQCQPRPSLRKRRGRLSAWAAGVTVAVLALATTSNDALDFVSPGDLSAKHAFEGECTNCHAAAAGGTAHWFTAGLDGDHAGTDGARCLVCHEKDLGEFSRLPHSVSAETLHLARERVASQPMNSSQSITLAIARSVPLPTGEGGEVVCATCHREHRGRAHDLTLLTNDQCQVCHVKPFASLADGHPEFSDYPTERRSRIQFNHVAHAKDAWPEKRAFACQDCHEEDVDGEVMLVVGYEDACGGCHAAEVDTSSGLFKRSGLYPGNSADGVPFIALPGFDPDVLAENDVAIGQWPEDATFDLEDPIRPMMRVLLAGDPEVAEALASLPVDMTFTDLSDLEEEEEFQAVGTVLWGVKGLIHDVVVDGQAALHERLEAGLGRSVSPRELSILTANLDVTAIANLQRRWFPKLLEEVPAHRDEEQIATELIPTEVADVEVEVGWYPSPTFDLRYRPSGHQDPFLKRWLEVSLERNEAAPKGVLEALFAGVAASTAEGGCVKCHSVDAHGATFAVNWQQKRRDLEGQGPNRFIHKPHLTALARGVSIPVEEAAADPEAAEADAPDAEPVEAAQAEAPVEATPVAAHTTGPACAQCHTLTEGTAEATDESFKGHDPTNFTSNFLPIDKVTCAGCHVSGEASDSCLNCHNYHVGERLHAQPAGEPDPPDGDEQASAVAAPDHPTS